MPQRTIAPIKARVARFVKLNECGVPITGAAGGVIVTGFISIAPSPQYLDGEEFTQREADGSLCINEKDPDELQRVELAMTFCRIQPDQVVMVTGERLLTAGGLGVTGTGVAFGEGQLLGRFSLEVWQPASGAAACDASGAPNYLYWTFMNVGNANIGEFSFENGLFNFVINAETKARGQFWDQRVGLAYLDGNTTQDGEHFLFNINSVPPPAKSLNGAVPLS